MITILIILNGLSFLLCMALELRCRSPFIIFFLVSFVIFFIPNTLYLSQFAKNAHSHDAIKTATIFVTVVNFVYLLVRAASAFHLRKKFSWVADDVALLKIRRMAIPSLLLCFTGLTIWLTGLLILKGSFSKIEWSDTLNVGLYSSIGNSFLFAGFGSIVLSYFAKRRLLLVVSILIGLFSILILRSRANLIPVFIPFLLIFLYRNNRVNLKFKYVLYGLLFVFSVFFLQQFRYLGELSNFKISQTEVLIERSFDQMLSNERGEFALVNALYKFIENDNDYPAFEQGNTYRRLLLLFIPTQLFTTVGLDLKPRDFAIDMYAAYYDMPNNQIGTMHPTFYGDLYANFGIYGGIIFISFFSLAVSCVSHLLIKMSLGFFFFSLPSICFSLVFLARGAVYNGVFIFLISSFLYFIFIKFRFRFGPTLKYEQ